MSFWGDPYLNSGTILFDTKCGCFIRFTALLEYFDLNLCNSIYFCKLPEYTKPVSGNLRNLWIHPSYFVFNNSSTFYHGVH